MRIDECGRLHLEPGRAAGDMNAEAIRDETARVNAAPVLAAAAA
jgi:hypothetical protein